MTELLAVYGGVFVAGVVAGLLVRAARAVSS